MNDSQSLMGDGDYTMSMCLCDSSGMVAGHYMGILNRLRRMGGDKPFEGEPFACTGSAHLAGERIRCTSSAHARHRVEQPVGQAVDALPERPERDESPLPEDLERILRDPEFITEHDHALHFWLAEYLRRHPDEHVSSRAYLGLWALYERATS